MDRGAHRAKQPGPPLSATAAIMAHRVLPLPEVLVVQLFVLAGMIIGRVLNEPRWYGAATGLGVALVLVVQIRGWSVPLLISERLRFWYERRRRKRKSEDFEPFDADLPGDAQIGFHWDGKILMSLVRILEDPQA